MLGSEVYLVTPEESSAGLILRAKHGLPFPVLSDPGGRLLTDRLGLWDEGRGVPCPAVAIVDAGGRVERLFTSADDRERPSTETLLEAVRAVRKQSRT